MEVVCIQPCWDGKKCQRYVNGNKLIIKDEDIRQAAMEPISKYFEGWPNIPVYAKEKGIEGYRIGGKGEFFKGKPSIEEVVKVVEEKKIEEPKKEEQKQIYKMCDWCGKQQKNLGAHKVHCPAKPKPKEEIKPE
jgi:hypothetical protein